MPREHGAYGQLAMPLVTAVALGSPSRRQAALLVATVALFVAHESVLLLLGHRGRRARASAHPGAWLAALTASAGVALLVWVPGSSPLERGSMAALTVLGVTLGALVARRAEKSLIGELLAALALTGVALPVALAGGVAPARAAWATVIWAIGFALAVLAVRGVLAHSRRASRWAGVGSCAVATAVEVAALALAAVGLVPAAVPFALMPFAAVSVALFGAPPHARHLKRVGWAIVGASVVTVAVVLAGLG